MNKIRVLRISLLMIICVAMPVLTRAQDVAIMDKWEAVDFSKQSITREQLNDVPQEELSILRGIVFGRHGRVFKDPDIKAYLAKRPWYKANPQFQNSMLNERERSNLDLIREAEAEKHNHIEPGDMRWWQSRALTLEQLGDHTNAEWTILRAEIEAIHGQRFDDQPWLQQYFDDRYWYSPAANYNPRSLSKTEVANIETINGAQKQQRNVALSPGDMEHFENSAVTDQMLNGLSLYELRLLRNEFYARHGRQFKTDWLAQYFAGQPWYEPRGDSKEPELSPMEAKNVETIVRYENQLKEGLTTKPVSNALLDGLFVEDARKLRNEIYARHGRVFKDKWLNKYFRSFDWYKPNSAYSDSSLSTLERQNVAAILAYEKVATSAADAVEG
ncbi:MAG: hypothetical protein QOH96_1197 [Blastocatellia bacterium]|nr:hypothetical protein [Blastocatellia bacterium]